MSRCARCGQEASAWTTSYFNTDVICLACSRLEQQHPEYERARRVEGEAVRAGDLNFPGIGLPADLR